MPDSLYDGDIFPGVMWYCEQCEELLNKQDGFYDYCNEWTCTECYHTNPISEEKITDYSDNANNSENSWDAGTIAIVGAALLGTLLVTSHLDKRQQKKQKKWLAIKKQQEETAQQRLAAQEEWEQYAEKQRLEEERRKEAERLRVAMQEDQRLEKEQQKAAERIRLAERNRNRTEGIRLAKQQERSENRIRRKKQIKAFLFHKKNIEIGAALSDFIENDVKLAVLHFHNAGFTNVQIAPIKDIFAGSKKQVGEVEQIEINGDTIFQKNSTAAYDAKIVITHHEKGEISFPLSPKQVKKMDVQALADQLQRLGYTNITTVSLNDLVAGWIKKDGAVKQLTVAGNASFEKDRMYPFDTVIVMTYHSLKSKEQRA